MPSRQNQLPRKVTLQIFWVVSLLMLLYAMVGLLYMPASPLHVFMAVGSFLATTITWAVMTASSGLSVFTGIFLALAIPAGTFVLSVYPPHVSQFDAEGRSCQPGVQLHAISQWGASANFTCENGKYKIVEGKL